MVRSGQISNKARVTIQGFSFIEKEVKLGYKRLPRHRKKKSSSQVRAGQVRTSQIGPREVK